jgi:Lrp/AsnC family leucine-responsive transcriptional regulator
MTATPAEQVDGTDWAIVMALQEDGRMALAELGRRVNLSASATGERVRRLEQLGVICGYHAEVDLARLGYPLLADVRLKYPGSRHQPLRDLLAVRHEVLECIRVTGDACYVMKVAATSMAHLEQVVDELAQFGPVTTSLVYSSMLARRTVAPPTMSA